MFFRIDDAIFEQYPKVILGVVIAKNINNRGEDKKILDLLRSQEAKVAENFPHNSITDHPHILVWREAYRKFGAKPKDYPSSVENLVRRVVKGENMRHINKLVDLYNYLSLKYLVPVGGEDTDKISGDVWLTFAGENEQPIVLLGEKEARSPHVGEVIYKDDIGAICRRWNWKEAERTKLLEDTQNAFLVIEGLPPVGREIIGQAVDELAMLVEQSCGGEISPVVLDKDNRLVVPFKLS